jgi:hypothetical protein
LKKYVDEVLMPTVTPVRLPSLMRVLEQRFLFDAAALIDPVWLAEVSSHSTAPLVVAPDTQEAAAIQSHADSTLGAQANTNVNNERNIVINTEATDGSVGGGTSIEENLVAPKQLVFGVLPNESKIAEAAELTAQRLATFANSTEFFSVVTQRFGNPETDVDMWAQPVPGKVVEIDTAASRVLPSAILSSTHGGAVASLNSQAGEMLFHDVHYRIRIEPDVKTPVPRVLRGTVYIEGDSLKALMVMPQRMARAIVRELGF